MRRADRLFQIIQLLRRRRGPITASQMAEELKVSVRTVYRDVADLVEQRVPVTGEAGFGYVLDRAFDMPPLMLTPDEIEAAVLGAQWVAGRGDAVLAAAALDLIAKITAVVPERLRPFVTEPTVGAVIIGQAPVPEGLDLTQTRRWIRAGKKIHIRYLDGQHQESLRTIWPTIIGFSETVRLLAAWCEMRQSFRHFRVDRVAHAEFLDERYTCRPAELRTRWKRHFEADRVRRASQSPQNSQ